MLEDGPTHRQGKANGRIFANFRSQHVK